VDRAEVSVEEALREIRERRADLDALLERLTPRQMVTAGDDGWTVKDHLTHLAAWEQSLVALLSGTSRHEALGVSEETYSSGFDAINEKVRESRAHLSLDDALAFYRTSHEEVLAAIARLSDGDLNRTYSSFQPSEPGKDSGAPIIGWIMGNTGEHYEEHIPWIRQIVEQQAQQRD
jgi:uncharacterized protein (TIGR03083 family)